MAPVSVVFSSILLLACVGYCDSVTNETISVIEGGPLEYSPPDNVRDIVNFNCQSSPSGIDAPTFFDFQNLGRTISAKAPFDREEMVRGIEKANESVSFECTYLLRGLSFYNIRINVLDLNDNPPTFDNGLTEIAATYPETGNYDGGLLKVSIPSVVDLDEGRNGTSNASFTLTHESVPGLFRLVSKRARNRIDFEMISTRTVDWEAYRNYQSRITVFDGGDPPRNSSLSVSLTFEDRNDNRPVFPSSRYDVSIQENAPVGTEVINLTAVDPDVGINEPLEYVIQSTRYFTLAGQSRDQLIEVPSNEWFEINETSGQITTLKVADREAYNDQAVRFVLSVRAFDSPISFGETFVYIDIKDANDNPPSIMYDPVYRQVPEDFDLFPNRLGTLSINDPDEGSSGMYNMQILTQEGQPSSQFTLANGVWNITGSGFLELDLVLNSGVDYDANKVPGSDRVFYHIVITAEDFGEIPQTLSVTLDIEVEDIDDNPPVFSSSVYSATVMEEISDTFVAHLTISDMDGPSNRDNRFLLPESHNEYLFQDLFQVNTSTGVIRTQGKLDRESLVNDTIPLLVVVESLSPARHSSSATVVITVQDTNDNAPVFQGESPRKVALKENVLHGTVVATIAATDADSVGNTEWEYSLQFQSVDRPFDIGRETGIITTIADIDAEAHPMPYHFMVQVYDGVHTSSLNFTVEVEDVNDNTPSFQQLVYSANIKENTEIGTVIQRLTAEDDDSSAVTQLQYPIHAGNEDGRFSIQEDGSIILIGHLDKEQVPSYTLTVNVSDGMFSSDTSATITIKVLNINDNPPQFTKLVYAFSVQENTAPNTRFGQVSAFDDDSSLSSHLSYSIEGKAGIDTLFKVLSDGAITTSISHLDREMTPSIEFTVLANDHSNPQLTGSASVVVTVLDQDDNAPSFPEPVIILRLDENHPIERTFYTTSASDLDLPEHAVHTYSITSAVGGNFGIDNNSGELSLRAPLDSEASRSHVEVIITASDSLGRSSTLNVTILVSAASDNAPVFPQGFPHSLTVEEGLPNDHLLHTFTVLNPGGGIAQMALTTPSGVSVSKFHIQQTQNTGSLYTTVPLDREIEANHSLRITLTNSESLSTYLDLEIEVLDINDNPPVFDQSTLTFTVMENQPNETVVGQVVASDRDSGDNGTVIYSFLSPSSLFTISPSSGVVQALVPLDRESQAEHMLVVVARDNGINPLQRSANLVIQVADVNDHAPVFDPLQEYTFQVQEDSAPGTQVGRLILSDADEGTNADITLQILDPYTNGPFGFHNRHLIVAGQLDYETKTRYVVHIQGVDGGGMSVTKAFTINVVDVNDETPQFVNSPVFVHVREDAALETIVATMRATDADGGSGGMIRYSIGMGNHHDSFKVNSTTGSVSVLSALDYEAVPSYSVEIIAEDLGEPSLVSIALLHVNVENTNDNSPIFELDRVTTLVSENVTTGTDVLTVNATDVDQGSIQYSILLQSPAEDAFRIDPTTGTISVNGQLDYLRVSKYSLQVKAADEDGLYSLLQVDIFVTNVNDMDPVFRPPLPSRISLPENTRVGYVITTVSAIDPDNATYSAVSLSVSGQGSGHFEIDQQQYYLRLVSELDAEDQSSITLTIRAVDAGIPPNEAEHVLEINVIDVNDNMPAFLSASYRFEVEENEPVGAFVGQVTATDADRSSNTITYEFSSPSNMFSIERDTGIIRTLATFDFESLGPSDGCISAEVIATDSDSVPASATVDVTLCITDGNDHAPVFPVPVYYFSVSQIATSESMVGTVTAEDGDEGSNSLIYYSLNGSSVFSIDMQSGIVRLNQQLGSTSSEYELTVTAADGGIPKLSARVRVVVYAITSGDHPPVFQQVAYSFTVEENGASNEIGSVVATDQESTNLLYSVQFADPNHFVITNSGLLSFARTPDREAADTYNLVVVAEDGSGRRTSAYVAISVTDINDNTPTIVNLPSAVRLGPISASGVLLVTLEAVDPDEGDNRRLSFALDAPGGVPLEVDASTGDVTTTGALEVGDAFMATFTVQDHGTQSQTSSVTVSFSVIDASDTTPDFGAHQSLTVSVLESAAVGQVVHTFTATSRITSDPPRSYFLARTSFTDGLFELVPDTGELVLREELDYETTTNYTFTVFAVQRENNVWLADYINVTLMVDDINDNPPIFSPISIDPILESRSKGDVLFRVEAHDRDSGDAGEFRYSITSQSYAPALQVYPDTGEVYVNSGLDAERGSMFHLVVTATDLGRPAQSSSQLIEFAVVDVNDHSPTFYGDEFISLREDSPLNVVVYLAHADDRDPSTNLSYSITSVTATLNMDSMPVVDDAFTINRETGEIRLNHRMNREAIDLYVLKVSVTDGMYSDTVKVSVSVLDVNDNPPQFLKDSLSVEVDELAGIGTRVVQVIATDEDWGSNSQVTYYLTDAGISEGFAVDSETGFITLAAQMRSYDPQTAHNPIHFNVHARDRGSPSLSSSIPVYVTVRDVNNNPPEFPSEPYERHVLVSTVINEPVLPVEATDADEGSNALITYRINPSNTLARRMFAIRQSGVLEAIGNLIPGEHTFTVEAWNASPEPYQPKYVLHSTTQVTITVDRLNSYTPIFETPLYAFTVAENVPLPIVLYTVQATDGDYGSAGTVVYSLGSSTNDSTYFSIDTVLTEGQIKVDKPLDREVQEVYEFTVFAVDSATMPKTGRATVRVTLSDENDNAPRFMRGGQEVSNGTLSFSIPENVDIDSLVESLSAVDHDKGENSQVTYSLSGAQNAPFYITDNSGHIRTNGHIDRERMANYTLLVTAKDRGVPPMVASLVVIVQVEDVNEFDPMFLHPQYKFTIPATTQPGTVVGAVTAYDEDDNGNTKLFYSITDSVSIGYIRINESTGNIILTAERRASTSTPSIAARKRQAQADFQRIEAVVEVRDMPPGDPRGRVDQATVFLDISTQFIPVGQSPSPSSTTEVPPLSVELIVVIAVAAVLVVVMVCLSVLGCYVCCRRRGGMYKVSKETNGLGGERYMQESEWDHDGKYVTTNGVSDSQVLDTNTAAMLSSDSNPILLRNSPSKSTCRSYEAEAEAIPMHGLGYRNSPSKLSSSLNSSVTKLPADPYHHAFSTSTLTTDYLHDGAYLDNGFNEGGHIFMPARYQDTSSHNSTHIFEQQGGGEGDATDRWGYGDEDSVKGFDNDDDVDRQYRSDLRSRSTGLLAASSELGQQYPWRHSKGSDLFRSQHMDVTGDGMTSGTEDPEWHPAPSRHLPPKRAQSSQGHVSSRPVMYRRQRPMDPRLMSSSHNVYQGMDGYYHPLMYPHSYMKGAKSYSGIPVPRKASSTISEPFYPSRGYRRTGRHSAMSGYSHPHYYPGHHGYGDEYGWDPYHDACTQSTHPDSLSQPSTSPMDEFALGQPSYGPKPHSPSFMSSTSSISVASTQISRQPHPHPHPLARV